MTKVTKTFGIQDATSSASLEGRTNTERRCFDALSTTRRTYLSPAKMIFISASKVDLKYFPGLQHFGREHDCFITFGLFPLSAVPGEDEICSVYGERGSEEFFCNEFDCCGCSWVSVESVGECHDVVAWRTRHQQF